MKKYIIDHSKIIKESTINILENLKLIGVFILISFLVVGIIRIDVSLINKYNIDSEETLTEWTQLFLVLINIYYFFKFAIEKENLRKVFILIACFFIVVFIREQDYLFDKIYHGFWVIPALSVTFYGIYYAFNKPDEGIRQIEKVLNIKAMKLIIIGIVLLLFYSRLMGIGSIWHALMGDNYVYRVKFIIEEGTELLSYFIITYGTLLVRKELNSIKV